jgi:hypothetical protein
VTDIAAALFLGQGGWLTCFPFAALAERVRATGVNVQTFLYTEPDTAARWFTSLPTGTRFATCGYSLGVTAATLTQEFFEVDLLISVAASTYARDNNRPVRHPQTKRSRLFYGHDAFSSAGRHDGYNETTDVGTPDLWVASHLSIQALPIVINGVLAEFAKLQKGN